MIPLLAAQPASWTDLIVAIIVCVVLVFGISAFCSMDSPPPDNGDDDDYPW